MKLLALLIIVCLNVDSNSLVLSKSSIEMCEDRGLHGMGDPQNLVDGKACEKKLVVLLTVRNNQNETERLYATVSRVRDVSTNEYGRLYNPFMITISKTPVYINYPYFYTGFVVNNQPSEDIKLSSGNWWASDSSKQCYDQWQSEEAEELKPSCGYQYYTEKQKQADGTYKDVKKRIWDSQGFCCHCTASEKDANTWEEAKSYKRSGIDCKFFTKSSQASAHCMKMDDLWYTVHSFEESYRDFQIFVRAYDQIEKVVNNQSVIEYVNGGEIVLSPQRRSAVGKYQRLIAHYVGDFAPVKSYPVLTERYFLIPKSDKKINQLEHIQVKDGVSKYLILPMSFVDLRGGACNKVGVSYSSFKNQAADGTGFGCQQEAGYCLMNQPADFFDEDQTRVSQGKTPLWFPTRYGKLAGLRKNQYKNGETDESVMLSFESEEEHVSLVSLQISADDIIVVYNRAVGEIIRAGIKDFESLSLDGTLIVEVRNIGYITSDFYVSVPVCSDGIHPIQQKSASINAQMTKTYAFSLRTSQQKGATYDCIVQLYDSKPTLLAQRNISFSTTTPCICEQMGCRCECLENGGVKCVKNSGKSTILPGTFTVTKKSSGFFGMLKGLWNNFNSFFQGMFGGVWQYIKIGIVCFVGLIGLMLFLNCGGLALCKPSTYKKLGKLKNVFGRTREKAFKEEQQLKKKPGHRREKLKTEETKSSSTTARPPAMPVRPPRPPRSRK